MLRHEANRGTGAARTTGTRAARGELLLMTDADGTYPSEDIPRLVKELESCDMVIGAREREMGSIKWLRTLAKEFIRCLASYMTQTRIPDLNSGLRGYAPRAGAALSAHSTHDPLVGQHDHHGLSERWVARALDSDQLPQAHRQVDLSPHRPTPITI